MPSWIMGLEVESDESLQEYAPDEQKELQDKASACIGHMLSLQ